MEEDIKVIKEAVKEAIAEEMKDAQEKPQEKTPEDKAPELVNGKWYEKLWRGEYPLCKAFWGGWFGGNFVLGFLYGLFMYYSGCPSFSCFFVTKVFALLSACWCVLAGVGVWRAACKYKGFELWKHLARICVLIALARYFVSVMKFIIF